MIINASIIAYIHNAQHEFFGIQMLRLFGAGSAYASVCQVRQTLSLSLSLSLSPSVSLFPSPIHRLSV